jgi:hypothetical protein
MADKDRAKMADKERAKIVDKERAKKDKGRIQNGSNIGRQRKSIKMTDKERTHYLRTKKEHKMMNKEEHKITD